MWYSFSWAGTPASMCWSGTILVAVIRWNVDYWQSQLLVCRSTVRCWLACQVLSTRMILGVIVWRWMFGIGWSWGWIYQWQSHFLEGVHGGEPTLILSWTHTELRYRSTAVYAALYHITWLQQRKGRCLAFSRTTKGRSVSWGHGAAASSKGRF